MATQHIVKFRTISPHYTTRKSAPQAKAQTRARREMRSAKYADLSATVTGTIR